MYANILISYEVKSLDKTFTYIIPTNLLKKIKIGMKVLVPFGNTKINGFILDIVNKIDNNINLKEIISIVDENILLDNEQLKMGKFIKGKTLCSLMTAYETMLPKGFKAKGNKHDYSQTKKYLEISAFENDIVNYINNNKKRIKQIDILKYLLNSKIALKSIFNTSSINTLKSKGLIREIKIQNYRINREQDYELNKFVMNNDQENAFNTIKNTFNTNITHLLYGVTGSGKTLVYLNLINEVINNNKTAIVLVPEISLTTQLVEKFYDYFGNKVAIFHSGLSTGEKYDEYLKIIRGEINVVVGTRSAIFTPLSNIGIIIIDEEHSDTYKQDNNPRYNAKDIALWRSKYHNCPVVLGSATPTIDSMARAIKKVYNLVEMSNRINNNLPDVKIIDMALEMQKRNMIFSDELKEKMIDAINNNHQVIIFLNRRGHSTVINCSNCGFTYKCPHCNIALTYHKTSNYLRCHYCGYALIKDDNCPNCHEKSLNFLGLGTEKVEAELKSLIPSAKIIRMDADTTTTKDSYSKIIKDFEEEKYNILVGTQMISKGLDFPNVTLVGVINADISLNMPDFKSSEYTFSLLDQVGGRSGRGLHKGNVIIQTFNPDNQTLNFIKNNDYMSFFYYEMNIRKKLLYPPYIYLCSIKVISTEYELSSTESTKIANYLKKYLNNNEIVLGPTTASMFKIKNKYHFQIIIKYKDESKIIKVLKDLDEIYINNKKLYLEIDLNPSRI